MALLEISRPMTTMHRMGMDPAQFERMHRQATASAVRAIRIEKGLTQEQCADRMDQSLQSWQNYEWGKRKFTPDLLSRIATAMDVTVAYIEERRETATPDAPKSYGVAEAETEFSAGPLSPSSRYRILVTGSPGSRELDTLIRQLQLHRDVLNGQ